MGIWFLWQRMRDSNPRKRSQSPVCYRYTNPLSQEHLLLYALFWKSQEVFQKFLIFLTPLFYPIHLLLIPPTGRVFLAKHGLSNSEMSHLRPRPAA